MIIQFCFESSYLNWLNTAVYDPKPLLYVNRFAARITGEEMGNV